MNDVIDVDPKGDNTAKNLRTVGWISYILHLVVAVAAVLPGTQASLAILILALLIDFVKKDDAAGTWQASHFSWRIRSVIWAGLLYVLTIPLWLAFILPGWIAWGLISLWFLYRIVRGMLAMNAGRPVGGAA